jgi:hypothetical protein
MRLRTADNTLGLVQDRTPRGVRSACGRHTMNGIGAFSSCLRGGRGDVTPRPGGPQAETLSRP